MEKSGPLPQAGHVIAHTRMVGWILVLSTMVVGCSGPENPEIPDSEIVGTWTGSLKDSLHIPSGDHQWNWTTPEGNHGTLTLFTDDHGWQWEDAGILPATTLNLIPEDPSWLPLALDGPEQLSLTPPLPSVALQTEAYPDLVAMVRDLTTPRFEAVVTSWPSFPVPVSSPEALVGDLDLRACLREAVERWNACSAEPFFVWDPEAAWGISLAHYSGANLRPPLSARLTSRDGEGRPSRLRIAIGDDYHRDSQRPYLVRGFAHELGHALLLWGHSPDRRHILWGEAPPIRDGPSRDECRAAHLLQWLPFGLELERYGVTPQDPRR